MQKIDKYKNKRVIVRAGGIIYKGVLKEITDEAINLKGITGWIEIPLDRVTSVLEEGEKETFSTTKFVDKSFWDMPPENDEDKK